MTSDQGEARGARDALVGPLIRVPLVRNAHDGGSAAPPKPPSRSAAHATENRSSLGAAPPADAEVVAGVAHGQLGGDRRVSAGAWRRRRPCRSTSTVSGKGEASGPQSDASARVIHGCASSGPDLDASERQRLPVHGAEPDHHVARAGRVGGRSHEQAAQRVGSRARPRRTPAGAATPSRGRRRRPSAVSRGGAAMPAVRRAACSRTTGSPASSGRASRPPGDGAMSRASMATGVPGDSEGDVEIEPSRLPLPPREDHVLHDDDAVDAPPRRARVRLAGASGAGARGARRRGRGRGRRLDCGVLRRRLPVRWPASASATPPRRERASSERVLERADEPRRRPVRGSSRRRLRRRARRRATRGAPRRAGCGTSRRRSRRAGRREARAPAEARSSARARPAAERARRPSGGDRAGCRRGARRSRRRRHSGSASASPRMTRAAPRRASRSAVRARTRACRSAIRRPTPSART